MSYVASGGRLRILSQRCLGDFTYEVEREAAGIVIHLRGEIDKVTAERVRDAIEPHMGPRQTIVLDLAGVRFMDSSCLTVLVQARGALTADEGSLLLRNPSSIARRVLTVAGLRELLQADADDHRDQG